MAVNKFSPILKTLCHILVKHIIKSFNGSSLVLLKSLAIILVPSSLFSITGADSCPWVI